MLASKSNSFLLFNIKPYILISNFVSVPVLSKHIYFTAPASTILSLFNEYIPYLRSLSEDTYIQYAIIKNKVGWKQFFAISNKYGPIQYKPKYDLS